MSSARILVVDDTPANLRLMTAALEPYGFTVLTVAGGEEALDLITTAPPDLVLLDIQMPGMNGYDVCRRIRHDLCLPALPVVMVTASLGEERSLALEAGADDFVVRPFDQAELLARVRSLLRIKEYHDQLQAQAAELSSLNDALEQRVAEQFTELDRLGRLRRFLPPHLADAVLSQGDEVLSPHRREVAVLTCRLHGFARMTAGAEPEEAVAALRDFHGALGGLVASCGATVGTLSGDAVTMFFNDPLPCDEPVLHALRLALALRASLGPALEPWGRRGYDLSVAAGISLGYATLGIIGFEGRYDYGAVGAVVDQASRLCAEAAAGEILLDQRALATVDTVVVCRSLERDGQAPAWAVDALETGAEPTRPIDVRVLGPVAVEVGGHPVPVTAGKERALLCLLAMRAGAVVSPERLADELWDGAPPESAAATLRAHVSRLRKALGAAGAADALVTRPTGYCLAVPPDAVDAGRFERLVAAGRGANADGQPEEAERLLGEALDLWRGPALVDVATTLAAAPEAARLEELRLVALEDRLDAALSCGRHREVLTELERLTLDHPLRERFWAQRMLALYRSGRQPEALRAYQLLRTRLVEELGLEPSPDLVRLEAAIARRSSDLEGTPTAMA